MHVHVYNHLKVIFKKYVFACYSVLWKVKIGLKGTQSADALNVLDTIQGLK